MDRPVRAALALGSGGARGYAHIGAIQVLEERGVEIVAVAGSSMGALVGGLWAAGVLDEYTEWASGLTQLDVVRLLDVSLSSAGAIKAEKILARVRELIGDIRIEDLPVPFTAVATDLLARREVWFQRGPLDVAIRSSIAIPGVITPVMLNGRLLADGGLMDPVPIAPTSAVPADLTVAVSLAGERTGPGAGDEVPPGDLIGPARESAEDQPMEVWVERFRRGASNLLDRDLFRAVTRRFGSGPGAEGSDAEDRPDDRFEAVAGDGDDDREATRADGDPFEALPAKLGKFDVMSQSIDALQTVLTRYRLAGYPPDVLVEVPKDACRSLDFHRADDLIALGRSLTEAALDRAGIEAPPEAAGRPVDGTEGTPAIADAGDPG